MAKVIGKMLQSFGRIHQGTTVELIEGFIEDKKKMTIVVVPRLGIQETVPTEIIKILKIIRGAP